MFSLQSIFRRSGHQASRVIRPSSHDARTLVFCALLLLAGALLLVRVSLAQTANEAVPGLDELKKGQYERAMQILSGQLKSNPTNAEAEKNLLRAFFETGRYAEGEVSAKKFLEKNPSAGGVRHQLAEVYAATGRYMEAVAEFERAGRDLEPTKAPAVEKLESDLRRAEVLEFMGQEEKAHEIFASFEKFYDANAPQTAPELTLVARAVWHLEKYKDASEMFQEAIQDDPSFIEAQLGGGELFTEKYNYAEAATFFTDALKINPNSARAHLGIAANKSLEGGEEMMKELARALEINPNMVAARALRASAELDAGRYDAASAEIDKALKVNLRSLEAHGLRAALLYLQDKDFQPEIAATLAINPRYGALYETLSRYATNTRRTSQAAEFSRRAIQLSPRLWRAHLGLGMALLRLGQMPEGRAEVEISFKGDPFNVWAKNTLDLLDAMKDYKEVKRGPFIIKADAKESGVLGIYAADLLDEAATKLTAKYHFTPQGPISIELFPNHEDFAVRTLGLPGLGALGVCFGQVIAADSPSARPVGEFNWGSTLWHEYTHVITLQMTDYRIPRWFSEGLSVYEERRARPGWGDDWNLMALRAFNEGRWFKIADLDAGFMRPRRADDVPLAYFQASEVCEFITDRYGFDAILKMLALYKEKAQTVDVLRQVLKLSEAEFDRAFMDYIESKARPLVKNAISNQPTAQLPKEAVLSLLRTEDSFALNLRAGALYQAEGDGENAARYFKRAIELFPFYTSEGNPYEALADIYEKKGDRAAAADIIEALIKQDENNLNALVRLTKLRLAQNDQARALEALRLSFYVNPFDYAPHARAGELLMQCNDAAGALKEFQAALALEPPNEAEAHYNVARAFDTLGQKAEAKRALLRALEAAPSYEKAQELLLKITGQ